MVSREDDFKFSLIPAIAQHFRYIFREALVNDGFWYRKRFVSRCPKAYAGLHIVKTCVGRVEGKMQYRASDDGSVCAEHEIAGIGGFCRKLPQLDLPLFFLDVVQYAFGRFGVQQNSADCYNAFGARVGLAVRFQ